MKLFDAVWEIKNRFVGPWVIALAVVACALGALSFSANALTSPEGPPGGPPAVVVDLEGDVTMMRTPDPRVVLVCENAEDADFLHTCQAFGLLGGGNAMPVSNKVFCFVAATKEVIRNGTVQKAKQWTCGSDREALKAQAKEVGSMKESFIRPLQKGEFSI